MKWYWNGQDVELFFLPMPHPIARIFACPVAFLILANMLWTSGAAGQVTTPAPLPEVSGSSTGYPTVSAALTALHAKAGVVFTVQNGWTVATDDATQTIWSFPPPGNPAFPAAVKRQIVVRDGATDMDMNVRCESTKAACDDLVRSFQQLNAAMAAQLRGNR